MGYRDIVEIDEEKCDGCALCVPSCAEGALKIINGKAVLSAENLCDGMGACLGHCPRGAIRITRRNAAEFDEWAVQAHLAGQGANVPFVPSRPHAPTPQGTWDGGNSDEPGLAPASDPNDPAAGRGHRPQGMGGCPGSRLHVMPSTQGDIPPFLPMDAPRESQLRQWPIQLTLLPPAGRLWQTRQLLLCADCVPFACADFHSRLLAGRRVAIACPKLDDCQPYVRKLAAILADHPIERLVVARMEVPCCGGLTRIAHLALQLSGRTDVEMVEEVVTTQGGIRNHRIGACPGSEGSIEDRAGLANRG